MELYEVTAGAAINNSARFAQIKFLQSDGPWSLVYFSVGSRLPVAHKKATLISLQVARDSGTGLMVSVNFSTQVSGENILRYIKVFFFNYSMYDESKNNQYIIFLCSIIIYIIFITLSFILETVQLLSLGSCFKMIFSHICLSFEKCGCVVQTVLLKSVLYDF